MKSIFERAIGSVWLRVAGAAFLAAIAILSLIPAAMQTRSALPGSVEHLLGYAAAAAILVLGSRKRDFPWRVILLLTLFSAAIEVLQNLSPGRNPEIEGVVGSGLGALLGGVAGYLVRRAIPETAPSPVEQEPGSDGR